MQKKRPSASTRRSVGLGVCGLLLMCAEWILLVAGLKTDEMIVGGAAILVSGAFLAMAHHCNRLDLEFKLADVAAGWRIPGQILARNWQITVILFKDVFGIERAGSHFRVAGFKTAKRSPVLAARRVLATGYSTAAPNFIVIGVDYNQSRMLFHQLERSSISAMTEDLGARP